MPESTETQELRVCIQGPITNICYTCLYLLIVVPMLMSSVLLCTPSVYQVADYLTGRNQQYHNPPLVVWTHWWLDLWYMPMESPAKLQDVCVLNMSDIENNLEKMTRIHNLIARLEIDVAVHRDDTNDIYLHKIIKQCEIYMDKFDLLINIITLSWQTDCVKNGIVEQNALNICKQLNMETERLLVLIDNWYSRSGCSDCVQTTEEDSFELSRTETDIEM